MRILTRARRAEPAGLPAGSLDSACFATKTDIWWEGGPVRLIAEETPSS